MTHTFLLIFCRIFTPHPHPPPPPHTHTPKRIDCEISSVTIFCKVYNMEEMNLF